MNEHYTATVTRLGLHSYNFSNITFETHIHDESVF